MAWRASWWYSFTAEWVCHAYSNDDSFLLTHVLFSMLVSVWLPCLDNFNLVQFLWIHSMYLMELWNFVAPIEFNYTVKCVRSNSMGSFKWIKTFDAVPFYFGLVIFSISFLVLSNAYSLNLKGFFSRVFLNWKGCVCDCATTFYLWNSSSC